MPVRPNDSLLVKKSLAMSVEGRTANRNWKWNNSNKRSGSTNKKSCNKNIANGNV